MRYPDYLRLDGSCSTALGLALIVVSWPGLATSNPWAWTAIPAVLLTLALIGGSAARHGIPLARPGRWLTDRPIRCAGSGGAALEPRALRRRLLIETAVWIVVVCAWVLATGNSAGLVWATGWASAAYGLLQLLASAPHAAAVIRTRETELVVSKRPAIGTPTLAVR